MLLLFWKVRTWKCGLLRGIRHGGGASRDRTDDPLLAKQVLSQLSYGPESFSLESPHMDVRAFAEGAA
jgi:hypothetical protein